MPAPAAPPADAKPAAETPAALPKKKRAAIAGAALAVLAGGGGFAWWHSRPASAATPHEEGAAAESEGEGEAKAEPAKAGLLYLPLTPAFVVNLTDDEAMRYLQVDIELAARDPAVIEAVKNHNGLIRNNLLLLLGAQRYFDIDTREEKERLQAQLLEEVRRTLKAQSQPDGVEGVYFTSFIMQ